MTVFKFASNLQGKDEEDITGKSIATWQITQKQRIFNAYEAVKR